MSKLDAVIGHLLREMKSGPSAGDFTHAVGSLLSQLAPHVPGFRGAFLFLTAPASKPAAPIASPDWRGEVLSDPNSLQVLAQWLGQFHEVRDLVRGDPAHDARHVEWLLAHLRHADAGGVLICPLQLLVADDLGASAAAGLVLVVAHHGAADAAFRAEIELVGWLIAQLRVNQEAARLARRNRTLAAMVDQGVRQILTRGPVYADVRAHFRELVSRIRLLLNCDTCQLYLLPRYVEGFEDRAHEDRVWLAAQAVANRAGLRCARDEVSLVAHLWAHPELTPLNISDVLYQEDYGRYGLEKLGLTRHFLGTVLTAPGSERLIGILAARDKYAVEEGSGGRARTAQSGFTDDDVAVLRTVAAELGDWLAARAGRLDAAPPKDQLEQRIEHLRQTLTADTCQLFLTPEVIGKPREGPGEYMELYAHARQDWSYEAVYSRGEGITGQVFATGEDVIVEDGLAQWLRLDRMAEQTGRRKPGKYRVSQHLMAVKIPAPPLLPDAEALAPIGVLKVRDRLDVDQKAISLHAFSHEDRHLLHAFAQMISVRIAIGEYARQRLADEMARHRFLTHAFRHDLVGNLIRPAILQLKQHPQLPEDLKWLPGHLEDAADMFDRSWVGASLAAGIAKADRGTHCDVAAVLRNLFPEPERCLFPDAEESKAVLCVRLRAAALPAELPVQCGQRLLEVALLALPVALYHESPDAPRLPSVQIDISVRLVPDRAADQGSAAPCRPGTADRVHVVFTAPLACPWTAWPPHESEDPLRHIVSYPKRLQCPPIAFGAFQKALDRHGARLLGRTADGQTEIVIDLAAGPQEAV